jgi:DNA-binding protein H-NS
MPTYRELQDQIDKLQREAAAARREEVGSAIREIKKKIAEFGLTAADIGLVPSAPPAGKRGSKLAAKVAAASEKKGRGGKGRKKAAAPKNKVPPKYRGANGESWTGRGRKPAWVVAELAAGKTLDQLLIQ